MALSVIVALILEIVSGINSFDTLVIMTGCSPETLERATLPNGAILHPDAERFREELVAALPGAAAAPAALADGPAAPGELQPAPPAAAERTTYGNRRMA